MRLRGQVKRGLASTHRRTVNPWLSRERTEGAPVPPHRPTSRFAATAKLDEPRATEGFVEPLARHRERARCRRHVASVRCEDALQRAALGLEALRTQAGAGALRL